MQEECAGVADRAFIGSRDDVASRGVKRDMLARKRGCFDCQLTEKVWIWAVVLAWYNTFTVSHYGQFSK